VGKGEDLFNLQCFQEGFDPQYVLDLLSRSYTKPNSLGVTKPNQPGGNQTSSEGWAINLYRLAGLIYQTQKQIALGSVCKKGLTPILQDALFSVKTNNRRACKGTNLPPGWPYSGSVLSKYCACFVRRTLVMKDNRYSWSSLP
jgi:hypothetical protein